MSDWEEDEESEKLVMQQSFLKMEANLYDVCSFHGDSFRTSEILVNS